MKKLIIVMLFMLISTFLFFACKDNFGDEINNPTDSESLATMETERLTDVSKDEALQWWNPGPCYIEYDGIEPLTKEQMLQIRAEWAEEWFDYAYRIAYNKYLKIHNDQMAKKLAEQEAYSSYENNIEKLFNERYFLTYSYLGSVNGCVVIYYASAGNLWTSKIGNIDFLSGRHYVLKDNEFYHLETAYNNGWLTEEDVNEILNKASLVSAETEKWVKDVERRKKEGIEFVS